MHLLNLPKRFIKRKSSSNGISIQEIHAKYNIISTLARQLAWNSDSLISIVINDGYFDTECQVYIRYRREPGRGH